MIAREVAFGTQVVKLYGSEAKYIRLNTSRHAIPRNDDQTVFANVATGKIRVVSKEAEVTQQ